MTAPDCIRGVLPLNSNQRVRVARKELEVNSASFRLVQQSWEKRLGGVVDLDLERSPTSGWCTPGRLTSNLNVKRHRANAVSSSLARPPPKRWASARCRTSIQ